MMRVLERELEERIRHELPHLSPHEVYDLARVVERLVETFQPERVYVFGSNGSMSSALKRAASQPPTVILISLSSYRRLTSHLTDWLQRLIGLWPLTSWQSISWSCRTMSSSAAAGPLLHSRPQCCGRGVHFMQPESLEEARDWLTRAQRDLLGAARALSGEPILADLAVFHAQ
jgi:hypothetical protein